jgi:hypothetical protein
LLLAFIGASVDYAITRDVIGGGGQAVSSTDYGMDATIGQPAIGQSSSSDYGWCHGFWCGPVQVTPTPTPTPGPSVPVGPALLRYQFTFDHVGIAAGTITLVVLFAARWLYDTTLQLWGST